MGWNQYGQLGDATSNPKVSHPERLGVDHSFIVATNVTAIAAGVLHSLFLRGDGSLWAMGDNSYGELGDGTYNMTNRPELIVANGVTAIAAGSGHSLFLKSDGSLWAMGRNNYTTTQTSQSKLWAAASQQLPQGAKIGLIMDMLRATACL